MLSIPGLTDDGIRSTKLVELIDLFPTLVEAAGYKPLPLCPEQSHNVMLCREVSSLLPLAHNPNRNDWKTAVFWQYPKGDEINGNVVPKMGYTIRTDRFRYTEWVHIKHLSQHAYKPKWGTFAGKSELYDLKNDPQENINRYEE